MVDLPFLLRYHQYEQPWEECPLPEGDLVLGRAGECDITLSYPLVSRQHARLRSENGQFWLTDLGSHNGIRLNGQLIPPQTPTPIQPGETFTIGSVILMIAEQEASTTEHGAKTVRRPSKSLAAETSFWLRYRHRDDEWREVPLAEGENVIGRLRDCRLQLDDSAISRRHSSLLLQQSNLWLMDLGSSNSTQIEGSPLAPHVRTPLAVMQNFTIVDYTFCVAAYSLQVAAAGEAETLGEIPPA